MRISDSLVIKLLSNSGISQDKVEALKNHEATDKAALQYLAVKQGLVSEEDLTKLYASEIDIPYLDIDLDSLTEENLNRIPKKIAKRYRAVVINVLADGTAEVAMEDPSDVGSTIYLRKLLGQQLKLYVATESKIRRALNKKFTQSSASQKIETKKGDKLEISPEKITQAINELVEKAIELGASDIHIEPREDVVVTRYRIDGTLREFHKLPLQMLNPLLEEIKLISGLSSSEFELPQSGNFRYESGDQTITVTVHTMPVMDGEKVVMKISNDLAEAPSLKDLGLWGKSLKELNRLIAKESGLVLVNGPLGSGRTTTLFSILTKLYSPKVNIATIEDPIEHKISGINQSAVNNNSGISFAIGLKAILEHDPNIIMVGELRDVDTAELVVRAAHKGHLILSSMFTTASADSIKRLNDLGLEPHMIAVTLNGIMTQRLVKRLCLKCAKPITPSSSMVKQIKLDFDLDENDLKDISALEKLAVSEEIGGVKSRSLSSSGYTIHKLWQADDEGCEDCDYSGYKGRVGLFEVLVNNDKLANAITSGKSASEIKSAAISGGMTPLKIDGFVKALRGITTLDEILRVSADA
jgi:type IV pilus assembly protein PilB